MTVHLLKLCVGISHIDQLVESQQRRVIQSSARGEGAILRHITRNVPRRAEELTRGGSIYWIIRGHISVRQAITGVETAVTAEGKAACALVLEANLVRVILRRHRAFQGWRYLELGDVPPDSLEELDGIDALPEGLAEELRGLGLI
ncbi:MAG: DUF1489 family protein [Rhodospirillales bacterium]|jgi:hypothetical protein